MIIYCLRSVAYVSGTNASCLSPLLEFLTDGELLVRRAATNIISQIAPEVLNNAPLQ